jgi:hypothetical protein
MESGRSRCLWWVICVYQRETFESDFFIGSAVAVLGFLAIVDGLVAFIPLLLLFLLLLFFFSFSFSLLLLLFLLTTPFIIYLATFRTTFYTLPALRFLLLSLLLLNAAHDVTN